MKSFPLMMLPFADVIEKLPLPAVRRMKAARADLDAIIYRLIDHRRRSGQAHGDLLSMPIGAQDEEHGGTGMTDQQWKLRPVPGHPLVPQPMNICLPGKERW